MADDPKPDMDVNLQLEYTAYRDRVAEYSAKVDKRRAGFESRNNQAKQSMYQDVGGLVGGFIVGLWNQVSYRLAKREAPPAPPASLQAYARRQQQAAGRKAAGRPVDTRTTAQRPTDRPDSGPKPATAES